MGQYHDPNTGRYRHYDSAGYPIDEGPYDYNPAANENARNMWTTTPPQGSAVTSVDSSVSRPYDATSRTSTKKKGEDDDYSLVAIIGLLAMIAALFVLYKIWWILEAFALTIWLVVNYHLLETFGLAALTAGALVLAALRSRIFEGSKRKQLALCVLPVVCLVALILVPPTLARHSLIHPNAQLAAEKIDMPKHFNPEDYRNLGEEGVAAILLRDKSRPFANREILYTALASIGTAAVPAMKEALASGVDTDTVLMYVPLLGEDAPAVVDPYFKGIFSGLTYAYPELSRPELRERILVRYPEYSLPAIKAGLESGDTATRRKAARVLIAFGKGAKPAIPWLYKALFDEDSVVRQNALWTLVKLETVDDEIVKRAIQLLKDPSEAVRSNARSLVCSAPQFAARNAAAIKAVIESEKDLHARLDLIYLLTGEGEWE